ncbi:MAG: hypothetical protein IKG25_02345 [Mogibacterium sp.]|nr:hypothetical protein [Mogibacterium sp.]MBR3330038.1 hypothetical protein [Mogibacterium sp.]
MERIRETVFEHEEGRDTVTITAAEPWSVSLMRKLKEQHPDEVDIYENKDGSIFGHVPASWMKLIPKRVASDRMRKHMEEMRNRRSK